MPAAILGSIPVSGKDRGGIGWASFPAGSASAMVALGDSKSCGEPSPVPCHCRALRASLVDAQTPEEAKKETQSPASLGHKLDRSSWEQGMMLYLADPWPAA